MAIRFDVREFAGGAREGAPRVAGRPMGPESGGRVVVVGGSSGIGRAVAARAHAAGARVTVGARAAGPLAETAAALPGTVTHRLDVTDEYSVAAFFEETGPLDHLVTCPGDMANGSVAEVALDELQRAFDTKIIGPLFCVRHALPRMHPAGSITLLAGAAGFRAAPGMAGTAAANAGIGGLALSLAAELAPRRVNVVVAGVVDTPLWDGLPDEERAGLFKQTAERTPVGRVGRPEDIAAAVHHLMDNTFITGSLLRADGGITL